MTENITAQKTENAEQWLCDNLLIGITGSVGATIMPHYVLTLRQRFVKRVQIILSHSARKFVTPLSLRLYSENPVFTDTFQATKEVRVPHIQLVREADLFLIMPATANVIGKAANGICDDLISTAIVACPTPVVFVPSMNEEMWNSKAVQLNVKRLRMFGHHVFEPKSGYAISDRRMANGAMPPLDEILPVLRHLLARREKEKAGAK